MISLRLDRIAAPDDAPFREILIVTDAHTLVALDFNGFEARMQRLLAKRYAQFELVPKADPCGFSTLMQAYFSGDAHAIDDIAVNPGGTEFQGAAWRALRSIPAGTTASYATQARSIGRPRAARAIGAANGQNPVAIVLPCHRVVGARGALTGYAGGVAAKQWLLRHEGAVTFG